MEECKEPLTQQNAPKKVQKRLFCSLDIVVSMFVVAPLVIACWRGIWCIYDIYERYFSPWWSFAIAASFQILSGLVRDFLHAQVQYKKKELARMWLWRIWRRMYTWVFACSCNMQWRGLWIIVDKWCGIVITSDGRADDDFFEPVPTWTYFVVCMLALCALKSLKNVMGVPMFVFLDDKQTFIFTTRFRTKMVQRTSLYILDCLFSVLVVGTLVVFVWRGLWVLIDIYLFPENEYISAWASLVLGYLAVAVAFLMQPGMRWLCDRIDGALRLFAADVFLLFSLVGTVNVWRGIWNLLNLYFLPDQLELSCWITHWVSLILLILLGCSNSLLVRGVYIDAEEPAGKCVVFPCYYLRLIFQQERRKRDKKNLQLDVMSKNKIEMEMKRGSADANHLSSPPPPSVVVTVDSNHHI